MKQVVRKPSLLLAAVMLALLMCMAIVTTSNAYAEDAEPLVLNSTVFDLQDYETDGHLIWATSGYIDEDRMYVSDSSVAKVRYDYDGNVVLIPLKAGWTNVTLYNSADEYDSVTVAVDISQNYLDGYIAKYESMLEDYWFDWGRASGTWWLDFYMGGLEWADDYDYHDITATIEINGNTYDCTFENGDLGFADTGNCPVVWLWDVPALNYNTLVTYDVKCGAVQTTGSFRIPKISIPQSIKDERMIVKLASSVTYTGKALKPAVTLRDEWDVRTLKQKTDYKVAYSNNKNVGKAKVVITGLGNYNGAVTRYFKIIPKGTTISKLTPGKKKMTVKWKKQTTQTQGYQIRYSLKSSMKNAKTVKVTSNKTTKKTIKKLKSKKKYYVQIRTYKTVKGTTYWSKWSAKKSVKVK